MKPWPNSILIGFAVAGVIGALACKKEADPTTAPAQVFTPVVPAAYGALKVEVKSDQQSVTRYFATFVSHYKDAATQPTGTNGSFNYLLARLDPRSTEGADQSSDEALDQNESEQNGLAYRGNLMGYFFGGWGRIRNDHITTASEAVVMNTPTDAQTPPFAIVPLPVAAGETSSVRYVVIAYGNKDHIELPLYATNGEAKAMLPPSHYLIVNVSESGKVQFDPPIEYGTDSEPIKDPIVLEAYQNITALRDALRLP